MDFPIFSEFNIHVPHPKTHRRTCGDEQDADVSVNLTVCSRVTVQPSHMPRVGKVWQPVPTQHILLGVGKTMKAPPDHQT